MSKTSAQKKVVHFISKTSKDLDFSRENLQNLCFFCHLSLEKPAVLIPRPPTTSWPSARPWPPWPRCQPRRWQPGRAAGWSYKAAGTGATAPARARASGYPKVAGWLVMVYGFLLLWGYPQKMDGLFHGKSHLEMDDDWG